MISVGVAFVAVDGAEGGVGVVVVHEGAGAVVDGFAGEGHVIGIEDAVDEADVHPAGDEGGLAFDGGVEEGEGWGVGFGEIGVVALEGVIGEGFEGVGVLVGGGPLEGADADVAGGDAGEDGAGEAAFAADDGVAGGGDGEAAGGGDAEGVHGFADEVFAKHGAEGGAAVATT